MLEVASVISFEKGSKNCCRFPTLLQVARAQNCLQFLQCFFLLFGPVPLFSSVQPNTANTSHSSSSGFPAAGSSWRPSSAASQQSVSRCETLARQRSVRALVTTAASTWHEARLRQVAGHCHAGTCRRLGAAEKIAVALQLYAFNSLSRIPRDTTASSACRVSFFQIQEMGLLNNKRRCPIFPPGLNGEAHPTARHCYRPRPDGTELCRWHERRSGLCVGFGRDAW